MSYLKSAVKNPTRESVSVSPPLRVLIADDHPLFRMGLRYALRVQGFIVVAEASDGREAVEAVKAHELEVALLDVKMPVLDGIQACEQITELKRRVLVVMLTTFEEPAIIKAAKEAGATAYLSKETDPAELAATLRKIVEKPRADWLPHAPVPSLTPREAQVLGLLAEGLSNKAMAKRLGISPETVKDYLNGVYRKLGVGDRLSAINRARELGLN